MADQYVVWEDAAKTGELKVASPTGTMADLFAAHAADLTLPTPRKR